MSERPCRTLRRRTSRLSVHIFGLDGAIEANRVPVGENTGALGGRQAMWVSWEGIFGLRPRAHTDPARLEAA